MRFNRIDLLIGLIAFLTFFLLFWLKQFWFLLLFEQILLYIYDFLSQNYNTSIAVEFAMHTIVFVLSLIFALSLSFVVMWLSNRLLRRISMQQKHSRLSLQNDITPSLSKGVKYIIIPFLLLISFLSLSFSAVLVNLLPPIFPSTSETFERVSINWPNDLLKNEPQGTKFWEIAVSECIAEGHKRFRITPKIQEHPPSSHDFLTFYIIEIEENEKWKTLMTIAHEDFPSFFRVGKFLSTHDNINFSFNVQGKVYHLEVVTQGAEKTLKNIKYQEFLAEIKEYSK